VLAVLCPGQGAQSAGFLTPWLTSYDVRPRLDQLSESAGFDLVAAGTDTSFDVVDTAVAQPLLVAAGVVTAELLGELTPETVLVGHSVGELTAAAVAGALDPADAVRIAALRGAAMKSACAQADGGMTAVLGGEAADVLAAIEAAGCVAANVNAAGQVVAAGTHDALARFASSAPAGARLRALNVAGPFHTQWMAPAAADLAGAMAAVGARAQHRGVVSNLDGVLVSSGDQLKQRVVTQLTAPVRFDLCLQTLRSHGVTAVVELAPAGVLAGIARRELPGVEVVAVRAPQDVEAARRLVGAQHPAGERLEADWRLIVAPARGTFHPVAQIDLTDSGRLGIVSNRSGDVEVVTDASSVVVEWLATDGDPVAAGQPLARVHG
jgi:[acyl-carrier-protein] S-malonyltransferase